MVGDAERFPAGVRWELRGGARCLFTVRVILLSFVLTSMLPAADVFDTICRTKGPVLGRVLETEELVRQSSNCAPATMSRSPLGHYARISGVVSLTILVDREGKVACVKLVTGHPLLASASLEAARKWTFRPMTQHGRPVSFFGRLDFQFPSDRDTTLAPCIGAPGPRGSSPGPALRARNCVHRDRPTRASAADQGVRPTVSPGAPPNRVKQIRPHLRILIVRR
jgi:TonB family protein